MTLLPKLIKSSRVIENLYRSYRKWKKRSEFFNLSTEEVFTKIYKNNLWREVNKNGTEIYSGPGSYGDHAQKYVKFINDFVAQNGVNSMTDAGCGDFAVGLQITINNPSLYYKGFDVVDYVIEENRKKFESEKIKFFHLDAAEDIFPPADLLTIRQVLQHLSNKQIKKILAHCNQFKYVIITEHLFKDDYVKKYNSDKPTGPDTRLIDNSGVYIDKAPFNMACTEVLSCRSDAFGKEAYLKSFLIVNY